MDSSVPLHSRWQGLEPLNPLTLLTVDYGMEIFGSEDASNMSQGAGAELSGDSVISERTYNI